MVIQNESIIGMLYVSDNMMQQVLSDDTIYLWKRVPKNFQVWQFLHFWHAFWWSSILELVDAAIPSQQLDLYKQTILQVEGVKVSNF